MSNSTPFDTNKNNNTNKANQDKNTSSKSNSNDSTKANVKPSTDDKKQTSVNEPNVVQNSKTTLVDESEKAPESAAKKQEEKSSQPATPVIDKKETFKTQAEQPIKDQTKPTNNEPLQTEAKQKSSSLATTLSSVAIALVVALGGGLYIHGHSQSKIQLETIKQLQKQVDELKPLVGTMEQRITQLNPAQFNQQIMQQQQALQSQLNEQKQSLANIEKESLLQLEQFQSLQNKVSTLSTTEANLWLLAEADFLVKQAARKLNTEKDVTTAIALLSSADASIREMNDPSQHELRKAIMNDISALSSIKRIDIDGTVIRLHQLSDQLDKMVLIKNQLSDAPAEPEDLEVSDSISDWKENLSKSWKGFVSDFISITPIDNQISDANRPELTANQGAYLRENIRLQLLIAAQAVPGYQAQTYQQAIEKTLSWIKQYYNLENPVNQAVIQELEALQKQDIQISLPEKLSCQAIISKQVETRLRNQLAQNIQSQPNAEK